MNEPNVNIDEVYVSVPLEFLKAVAHIGIDFGYGEYELEQKWLDLARRHYEASEEVEPEPEYIQTERTNGGLKLRVERKIGDE